MSRAASLPRAALAQAAAELRLTARRGENLLAMLGIPIVVLLFFASSPLLVLLLAIASIDRKSVV